LVCFEIKRKKDVRNLQFLDNVIIIKTKDLLPQASEILADLWPLVFIAPKDFKIIWFSNLSTLSVHFEVDSKKGVVRNKFDI